MAGLNAKFAADFQSFYTAVDQANARLTDFTSGASRVESALNRMVDNFSGRKLIQDATLAAQAVESIGGAGKLTEDELQRVAQTAANAVAKMNAMGVEVPANIQALANRLEETETTINAVGDAAGRLAEQFLVMFAVTKITQWAESIGKGAEDLENLSLQTQTSVEDLQVLGTATQEYGVDSEQLGRALFQLSQRIAGGDASVVTGLHAMGLSIQDVKDKDPIDLFLTVERALAGVSGAARDAAAADLFGSRLGASLTAFAPKADEAIARARALADVIGTDDNHALAEMSRNLDLAETNLSKLAASLVGPVAQGFNTFFDAHAKGASYLSLFVGYLKDEVQTDLLGIQSTSHLADVIDQANQKTVAATAAKEKELGVSEQIPPVIDEETRVRQALAKVEEDANVQLADYQVEALNRLKELGALNAKNAAQIAGVNAEAFDKYKKAADAADAAAKKLADDQAKGIEELSKLDAQVTDDEVKHSATATEAKLADLKKQEDSAIASLKRIGQATDDNVAHVKADYDKLADDVGIDWSTIQSQSRAAHQDLADTALRTYQYMAEHASDFTSGALQKQLDKYRELEQAASAMGEATANAEDKAAKKTEEENKKLDDQKKKAEAVTQVFSTQYDLSTSKGLAAFEAANPNATVNAGVDYFKTHTLAQAIADGVVVLDGKLPGFAAGVEDFSGGPAVVGEDGPELVNLPRGASVLPLKGKRSTGGATQITVHQYVSGVWDLQSRIAMTAALSSQLHEAVGLSKQL